MHACHSSFRCQTVLWAMPFRSRCLHALNSSYLGLSGALDPSRSALVLRTEHRISRAISTWHAAVLAFGNDLHVPSSSASPQQDPYRWRQLCIMPHSSGCDVVHKIPAPAWEAVLQRDGAVRGSTASPRAMVACLHVQHAFMTFRLSQGTARLRAPYMTDAASINNG